MRFDIKTCSLTEKNVRLGLPVVVNSSSDYYGDWKDSNDLIIAGINYRCGSGVNTLMSPREIDITVVDEYGIITDGFNIDELDIVKYRLEKAGIHEWDEFETK